MSCPPDINIAKDSDTRLMGARRPGPGNRFVRNEMMQTGRYPTHDIMTIVIMIIMTISPASSCPNFYKTWSLALLNAPCPDLDPAVKRGFELCKQDLC